MVRKEISPSWDRDNRNAMNDNFSELYSLGFKGGSEGSTGDAISIRGKSIDTPTITDTYPRYNGSRIIWVSLPNSGSSGGSGAFKSIEDYGAIKGNNTQPNGAVMNANLNAIKASLSDIGYAFIPPGYFWVNGIVPITGGQRLFGVGQFNSFLKLPANSNHPAIEMDECDGAEVSRLQIAYNDWSPHLYTNRTAIFLRNIVRNSSIEQIEMLSVYRGLAQDDKADLRHNTFNIDVNNIKAFFVAKNFLYFNPQMGGNTGSVFTNLYLHNGARGNRLPDDVGMTPIVIRKTSDSVFNQLNLEWSSVTEAMFLESNRNLLFNSVHLEGLDMHQDWTGLIHVVESRVVINTLDIYDIKFRSGGTNSVFHVNFGGDLKVDGFTESATTMDNGTVARGIISDEWRDDRIEIEGARPDKITNFEPTYNINPSNGKPKLIRFNDALYYHEVVSPDGSIWKFNISNAGTVTYTRA